MLTAPKKTDIKRSTVHIVLERLLEKNFMTVHFNEKTKIFNAVRPSDLLISVQAEKESKEKVYENLKKSLPEFERLYSEFSLNPKVSFFNGIDGVIQVMEETLKGATEMLCYSNMEGWFKNEKLKKYIIDYAKKRVRTKKRKVRSIDVDTPEIREYLEKKYPRGKTLTETKWLPKNILPFCNEINIFDEKVAICSLEQDEMMGVIIESSSIAKTFRSIFEQSWVNATKGKSYE